ncbi:MAG: hypothetical protein DKM50_13585 [Candidatus Margulisiibacteriota bacterium]|nr:MAG: hypothetical protein DKM50_13585 [Candidatus Margulisiibacteriota bacterium]HCY36828.1 hypothetical protein [Candidatus Margulisiibacteriota bacterium]
MNWIYEHTPDNKARFILGEKGNKPLICIGINPSTATPANLDKTAKRVQKYTSDLCYNSWIMLNVYPQIDKNSENLHKVKDTNLHKQNLEYIESILTIEGINIWAAWGTIITERPYLFYCLRDIHLIAKKNNKSWYSAGNLLKDGHPRHPSRMQTGLPLKKFDIDAYLNKYMFNSR